MSIAHEHTRKNIDNLIIVNCDNVIEDKKLNFERRVDDGTDIRFYYALWNKRLRCLLSITYFFEK